MLTIIAPKGEVFPYIDQAKQYLQAGVDGVIDDYAITIDNPQVPVQIAWSYDAVDVAKFLVEYARKDDYSDAICVETSATQRSIDVYNLYKATKYYVRVTALNGAGEQLEQAEGVFQTTTLGPRVMNVDGAFNVRDLGGRETSFGKTIAQGIAYRGGTLMFADCGWDQKTFLTDVGAEYLSKGLGIKTELDFRSPEELGTTLDACSPIAGAKLVYITIDGYESIFHAPYSEGYRKAFSFIADKNRYPIYMHCTAGADRTGTFCYLLYAFLGVSELECLQDYEFTSFSLYGLRGGLKGVNNDRFAGMLKLLSEFDGETLQEKTENYLLSIGVTQAELANIKEIFLRDKE